MSSKKSHHREVPRDLLSVFSQAKLLGFFQKELKQTNNPKVIVVLE